MAPLMIQIKKLEYKNIDAANNLIRYITRTRPNEDRAHELLLYGFNFGRAYNKPIKELIQEFEFVQKRYYTQGSLMCHYVIHISQELYDCMNNDLQLLSQYAQECCEYLFTLGHQSCYAIHYSDSDRLHIHLAINAINFQNGHKLRQYPKEIKQTVEKPLIQLLEKYTYSSMSFPVTH